MKRPQAIEQAAEHLRSGEMQSAQRLLREYLRSHPQSDDAWYLLSFALATANEIEDALKRALKLNPSNDLAQDRLDTLRDGKDSSVPQLGTVPFASEKEGGQRRQGAQGRVQAPRPPGDCAIEMEDLRRGYKVHKGVLRREEKEVLAVDGITIHVPRGELFGLLGPNGAGKTTTVKMLTTLLLPTSGTARVGGFHIVRDAQEIRKRIGFIFGGERGLYWRLSGRDNLRYFASLYHVEPDVAAQRIPRLLELVGLSGRADEKVEGFSRGMKQRLHVARTLLHDPEILFLDEPTLGLDPVGARQLRQVIRNMQQEDKTILLTTHYMFEADALCDRIGVIDQGKIVALDTPEGLKKHVRDLSVIDVEAFGLPDQTVARLRALPYVDMVSVEARDQRQSLRVHTPRGAEAVPELMAALEGQRIGRVQVREPTLEDAYVRLVGGQPKVDE